MKQHKKTSLEFPSLNSTWFWTSKRFSASDHLVYQYKMPTSKKV